jgi:hypothetical protein
VIQGRRNGCGEHTGDRHLVTVYQAYVTDASRGETIVTRHKGTAAWIASLPGGEAVLGTAEEVDETDIDGQGRHVPKTGPMVT